jgi:hypothetical protein
MTRELVSVLSPVPSAPVPLRRGLSYSPKALALGHDPKEVMLPLRDDARFVLIGKSRRTRIVYTPKPLMHDPEAGPPFVITDELPVYQAALLARDRHPADGFLSTLNILDPEQIAELEHWIGRRHPSRRPTRLLGELRAPRVENVTERDRRICWAVARELSAAIAAGTTKPVRTELDPQGRPIYLACLIQLADALAVTGRRGDAGVIFSSLASWYDPIKPEPRKRPPSRLKPFWPEAEAVVMGWLEENGCPQAGDGNQAKLERFVASWLEERGLEASDSAIHRHVRGCIERYRESLKREVHWSAVPPMNLH